MTDHWRKLSIWTQDDRLWIEAFNASSSAPIKFSFPADEFGLRGLLTVLRDLEYRPGEPTKSAPSVPLSTILEFKTREYLKVAKITKEKPAPSTLTLSDILGEL